MPCLTLEPLPRFPGFWSTRTPASRATWTVWSVEPSSTTTTSANSHGEAPRYSRTFTREAGNRLASLYAGMIMERERFKRRFIIAYFAIGALFVPRRRLAQTAAGADPGNRGAGLPRLRPPVRVHAHGAGDSGGVRREIRRGACAGGAGAHRRTTDDVAPRAQGVCDPGADRFVAAPATGSARVHRSGDADDAAALRRGHGASLRDAPQYAGHRSVPAHRAGTLFEAAGGGRHGPGVRDQPQFPQRRALDTSQPRVHHAGVLPGVHGLSRADRFLRGTAAPDGD